MKLLGMLIASVATSSLVITFSLLPALSSAEGPVVDDNGTIHVPAFSIPESSFLPSDTRSVLKKERNLDKQESTKKGSCPQFEGADNSQIPAIRQCEAEEFYKTPSYQALRKRYPVNIQTKTIGGVYTEIFTPADGVSSTNRARVLINVHGGGFICCARTESHSESVPIASVGKIKVISIDYRQAPEYKFPIASEDVAAVYRELLKTYKPSNIGIYGCSSGGLLTAESIAWFQKERLPPPAAVGMFCEGAGYWTEGDSGNLAAALGWWGSGDTIGANPYFKGTDPYDPLAFPARSAEVLAKFPPSLLISGTRDTALSSVVYTHSVLRAQGVVAELRVWEGLGHGFFIDSELPQSSEVYSAIVKFFDTHFGK
jgi:acetyl esterase/lipase